MSEKPLVAVIDDDAASLSPFFVKVLQANGYRVRVCDRLGKAVEWLESKDLEAECVAAVILDIMFVLPIEDHDAFEKLAGRQPEPEDAARAGKYLIPFLRKRLSDVSILVLTNHPFTYADGRDLLGDECTHVDKVFHKPAQEQFYKRLHEAVENWESRHAESYRVPDQEQK